jgi:hypothetical protein
LNDVGADNEKSTTLTGIMTERCKEPNVPVTVTVNVVATDAPTVRVEVCEPPAVSVTLVGAKDELAPESVV